MLLLGGCVMGLAQTQSPDSDAHATQLKVQALAAVQKYLPMIQGWSTQTGVDQALLIAVITVESDGDPNCVSSAGAMGLMQLMPETCTDLGVSNPFDPDQNVRAGAILLAVHLARYGGDLKKTLVAYNAGPGRVPNDAWMGIPETRRYVAKVLDYYNALGGSALAAAPPSSTDTTTPQPPAYTGPIVNSMDVMFEAVQSAYLGTQPDPMAEDGMLDDVAGKLLDRCEAPLANLDKVAAKAAALTARTHFNASDVHAFCFSTPDRKGFLAGWGKTPPVVGRYVGLAHASMPSGEIWVIVIANKAAPKTGT